MRTKEVSKGMQETASSIFAINPRLKDSETGEVMRKFNRGYAQPATGEEVEAMLRQVRESSMVSDIRNGQEQLKDVLPTVCPHYSSFNNNHRSQADIIPEAFTFRTCVDVDEESLVEDAIKRAMELVNDDLSDWQELIEYIES